MTTLVLTPLAEELQALVQGFTRQGYSLGAGQSGQLPVRWLPALDFVLAQGGHGKVQFGIQTQYLLDHDPNIDLVICTGAAGGLDGEAQIGDLVVATETIEHDYRLRFSVRPQPRFPGANKVLVGLRAVASCIQGYRVHFGIVASGDEDVIDPVRARELYAETGAQAVAWEGAGGARACAFMDVPYLEIRGLTDIADNNAPVIFDENLKIVMPRIAELLTTWAINR